MPPVKQKTITMQCDTPDAEIRYEYSPYGNAGNCPEPTEESTLYTEPIVKSAPESSTHYIKAKAFKTGMIPSDTVGADVDFTGSDKLPSPIIMKEADNIAYYLANTHDYLPTAVFHYSNSTLGINQQNTIETIESMGGFLFTLDSMLNNYDCYVSSEDQPNSDTINVSNSATDIWIKPEFRTTTSSAVPNSCFLLLTNANDYESMGLSNITVHSIAEDGTESEEINLQESKDNSSNIETAYQITINENECFIGLDAHHADSEFLLWFNCTGYSQLHIVYDSVNIS